MTNKKFTIAALDRPSASAAQVAANRAKIQAQIEAVRNGRLRPLYLGLGNPSAANGEEDIFEFVDGREVMPD